MRKYYIQQGATAEYMKTQNAITSIAEFIASMEGKEIVLHATDDTQAHVSQYDKSTRYTIPIEYVESREEEEEEIIEEEIVQEKTVQIKTKHLKWIAGIWIVLTFGLIVSGNIQTDTIKTNVQEVPNPPTKTAWEILSEKETIINQKIDFELQKQKELRQEIENSIEQVYKYEAQKKAIREQKIELAQ